MPFRQVSIRAARPHWGASLTVDSQDTVMEADPQYLLISIFMIAMVPFAIFKRIFTDLMP